jgi:hypothetical protein
MALYEYKQLYESLKELDVINPDQLKESHENAHKQESPVSIYSQILTLTWSFFR